MPNKAKIVDMLDNPFSEEDSKEGLYKYARKFFIDNGVLTDYEFNDMVIGTHMASKSVKNTEFFVDKNQKRIKHIIYLSRFGYLFKNHRKLQKKVYETISPIFSNSGYGYESHVELVSKEK